MEDKELRDVEKI
jgi:hypothetical protein